LFFLLEAVLAGEWEDLMWDLDTDGLPAGELAAAAGEDEAATLTGVPVAV